MRYLYFLRNRVNSRRYMRARDVRLDFISRRGTRFFPPQIRFQPVPAWYRPASRFPRWSTHRKILSSSRRSHRSDAQPKVRWHEYPVSFGSWTRVNNAASLSPRFETARKNVPVAINNRENLSCRFGGGFASSSSLIKIKKKNKNNISFFAEPGSWKMASYGHLEPIDSVAHGKIHAPLGTGT